MDELLIKYTLGEATQGESAQIRDWVAASADNQRQLDQFSVLLIKTEIPVADIDQQAAWHRLRKRLQSKPAGNTKIVSLYRVAAAAVILSICFFAWHTWQPSKSMSEQNKKEPVKEQSFAMKNHYSTGAIKVEKLPDGSVVILQPNSNLIYPEKFAGDRNTKLEGKAFFDIAHDAAHPFNIIVNDLLVKVTGTSFTIDASLQETKIIVHTGIVEVTGRGLVKQLYKGDSLVAGSVNSIQVMKRKAPVIAFPDNPKEQQIIVRSILKEIQKDKLTVNSIHSFSLDSKAFIINNKTQSVSNYHKYKIFYLKSMNGFGIYYGDVTTIGKGIFITKKEILQP